MARCPTKSRGKDLTRAEGVTGDESTVRVTVVLDPPQPATVRIESSNTATTPAPDLRRALSDLGTRPRSSIRSSIDWVIDLAHPLLQQRRLSRRLPARVARPAVRPDATNFYLLLAISPPRSAVGKPSLHGRGLLRELSRSGGCPESSARRVDLHPDAALPFVEFKRAGLAGDPEMPVAAPGSTCELAPAGDDDAVPAIL